MPETPDYATQLYTSPEYDHDHPDIIPPAFVPFVDFPMLHFIWNRVAHTIPCKDGSYIDNDTVCGIADDDEGIYNEHGRSIYWNEEKHQWTPEENWTTTIVLGIGVVDLVAITVEVFDYEGELEIIYEGPETGDIHDSIEEALAEELKGPNQDAWRELIRRILNDKNLDAKLRTRESIFYELGDGN